jgi:hypothetical protein
MLMLPIGRCRPLEGRESVKTLEYGPPNPMDDEIWYGLHPFDFYGTDLIFPRWQCY